MNMEFITAAYAAALALLLVAISFRVSWLRLRHRTGIHDGGHGELARAIRVQGNFTEYVPFALLVMLFMELHAAPEPALHAFGSLLVLARVLHAIGLSRYAGSSGPRYTGTLVTWTLLVLGACWLIFVTIS